MKRASSLARALLALLVALAACGGKAATYEQVSVRGAPAAGGNSADSGAGTSSASGASPGGAPSTTAGGSSGHSAGGASAAAGASGTAGSGGMGGTGGQLSAGGSAGIAGEGASAGASGAAGTGGAKPCTSVTECPRPLNACLIARCSAGSCVTDYAPAGALHALDAPADCHATTACDGSGHATLAIDQSNAPIPSNQCLVGTCNASGTVGSEPLPSGAACHVDAGGGRCDGQGGCVACLVTADCPLGQSCNAYRECVGLACSDVHCGGACPACVGQACAKNNDCASKSCELASHLCVTDSQCADTQQNGNETDVDCGGGTCSACALGKACLGNTDCASFACHAVSLLCTFDACTDLRMDGDESDVDCGGTSNTCGRCGVGQKCNSNLDCMGGHFCPQGTGVCQ